MSDIKTPCQVLGYKVGDKFEIIEKGVYAEGSIVTLHLDDRSRQPLFIGEGTHYACGPGRTPGAFVSLHRVKKLVDKHKVGDKYKVIKDSCGFKVGTIVTLNRMAFEEEDYPRAIFAGPNAIWTNARDESGRPTEGAWADFTSMEKIEQIDFSILAPMAESLAKLQAFCHDVSARAGWWSDVTTGEAFDPVAKGPEKIALMHSELSEALEGLRKGLMDDKLPHRPNAEVELADAVIRILDWAGAMGYDIGGAIQDKLVYNANREDHKLENRQASGGKKF